MEERGGELGSDRRGPGMERGGQGGRERAERFDAVRVVT